MCGWHLRNGLADLRSGEMGVAVSYRMHSATPKISKGKSRVGILKDILLVTLLPVQFNTSSDFFTFFILF